MKVTNNQQDTSFGTIRLVRFRGKRTQRVMVGQARTFIGNKTKEPITQAIPYSRNSVLVLDDSPLARTFIAFKQCKDALIGLFGMHSKKVATKKQNEVREMYLARLEDVKAVAKPINYRAK